MKATLTATAVEVFFRCSEAPSVVRVCPGLMGKQLLMVMPMLK